MELPSGKSNQSSEDLGVGLGNIGPAAAKPVMEGKAMIFKFMAGVDAFDIEIDEEDPERLVAIIKAIAPTFGGINLEDIKAPECFTIESALQKALSIPVMHDDQHGAAIIIAAALKNALLIADKSKQEIKIVINGAGASAIACAHLLHAMGIAKSQIVMLDSKGVIHKKRKDLNPFKEAFATDHPIGNLTQTVKGSDVFIGLSKGNLLSQEALLSMAPNPIVFALANPTPEIDYLLARKTRDDIIIGTGRSDYPNQINNAIVFPFIFRALLDVRATKLNDKIKLAAVDTLATLVHSSTSGLPQFGRDYLIPKLNDSRLLKVVTPAIAKAAMETGVAQNPIKNWDEYQDYLQKRMNLLHH